MSAAIPSNAPALRFQRAELREKAALSPEGLACLATAPGPRELIAELEQSAGARDAVNALAQILPHRQAVWWACLVTRLYPALAMRPSEMAAVTSAETWVQTNAPADAARALAAAEACDSGDAPHWAAMAAYWSGPTLAPPDQPPVAPAPHLPGIAVRTVLLLTVGDAAFDNALSYRDVLGIGVALMNGDLGRTTQAAVRDRLLAAGVG